MNSSIQSMSSQQWPGHQWESTNSCTTAAHNIPQHKLRRTWSDPGIHSSVVEREATKQSDMTVVCMDESSTDLIEGAEEAKAQLDYADKRVWSGAGAKLEETLFGRDELVQMEDYYYEDEESNILSFKNCSLRIHGIILLILIYAAGYLAYTFAGPPSRRKCQQTTALPYMP